MFRIIDKEKGFSLVEIIVVMILIGIMGTLSIMGIMPAVQGMVFTKANAETTQKGQIAITKLIKEFNNINGVMAGANATSVVFTSIKSGSQGERSVMYANNKLYFNDAGATQGDILTDEVNDFQLHYYNLNPARHSQKNE
jgi:prepilin-type N-terminal cleavage/methylation domain-containing protein